MNRKLQILTLLGVIALGGCQSAQQHAAAVNDSTTDKLTVGTVQREIRVGMPSAEVASVMGSPNVVSTDAERREVWIYDKISTNSVYSRSSGGVWALILGGREVGGSGIAGGLGGAGYDSASGASSTSQRTLTVIVKFDEDGLVRDFSYHSSSF